MTDARYDDEGHLIRADGTRLRVVCPHPPPLRSADELVDCEEPSWCIPRGWCRRRLEQHPLQSWRGLAMTDARFAELAERWDPLMRKLRAGGD